jgi:hypothetical protein
VVMGFMGRLGVGEHRKEQACATEN